MGFREHLTEEELARYNELGRMIEEHQAAGAALFEERKKIRDRGRNRSDDRRDRSLLRAIRAMRREERDALESRVKKE